MFDIERFSDKVAFVDSGNCVDSINVDSKSNIYTYADIADIYSNVFKDIKSRVLIGIIAGNNIESFIAYMWALHTKNVPLMLGVDMWALEEILKLYTPHFIWQPKNMEILGDIIAEFGSYALIRNPNVKDYVLHNDLALLLSTSGSTGSQKFVRISYKNLLENTQSIVKYLNLTSSDSAITSLPTHYSFGLSNVNTHLFVGGRVIVSAHSFVQQDFWDLMQQYEISTLAGVPYSFEMLDRLKVYQKDLPYLRRLLQAGGKLSEKLHQKFAEYALMHNKEFYVMYGQTEASPRMGYLPPKLALQKVGAMGIAIPHGKFMLIDEKGVKIDKPNTAGELIYKGNNVALGYAFNSDDLQKGDEFCGVLKTGDIARFDKDGIFYIIGRKSRFVKAYGNRVSLDELEHSIKHKFIGLECACVGSDNRISIFITKEYKEEVKKFVVSVSGLHFSAFVVQVIKSLPKNSSGKIMYEAL